MQLIKKKVTEIIQHEKKALRNQKNGINGKIVAYRGI